MGWYLVVYSMNGEDFYKQAKIPQIDDFYYYLGNYTEIET